MNLIVEKIRKNDAFKNASRRIAANIAKLPDLLREGCKAARRRDRLPVVSQRYSPCWYPLNWKWSSVCIRRQQRNKISRRYHRRSLALYRAARVSEITAR
jgi:hypothetical protein